MRNKYILLVITAILFNCCKKEINSNRELVEKSEKEFYLDLYFPDTVNIKNIYEGEIKYKSPLDTITTKFFVEGDSLRMLTLYLKDNVKLIKDDYEHIINDKVSDTFYPSGDSNKLVFKHKFDRLGLNYLEGVLEDEIYFKTSDTSKLRIITRYNHITLPVFVTDNDNIVDSYFKENSIKLPIRI